MRPAPLLLALLLAWAVLGGLVLGGLLPRWSWALAAVAIAVPALMDMWRQSRRPSPQVQRELPEALALGVRREAALRLQADAAMTRSEEHTSELQSQSNLVCRLLLGKK